MTDYERLAKIQAIVNENRKHSFETRADDFGRALRQIDKVLKS